MSFASPIWLLGLLPWAVVAVWLMLGRRPRVKVPFLPFWKDDEPPPPRKKRGLILPPVAVLAAMGATLLGILGAAGPRVGNREASSEPLTIIVDRGITMSARGERMPRYREVASASRESIARAFGASVRVRLACVPGEEVIYSDAAGWTGELDRIPPTALDTRQLVPAAVAHELASGVRRLIVITDQAAPADDRVIRIGPAAGIDNVGITHIAARAGPPAEVMVRIRNSSRRESATLRVDSGAATLSRQIDLPPAGGERDYFIAVPALADSVIARITPGDALEADDTAFLARQGFWPKLEARTPLPEELIWMMQVYSRQHPPADESKRIAVSDGGQGVSAMERAAVIGPATQPATRPAGEVTVASHPVTASVNWRQVIAMASLVDVPAGGGWEPVVTASGRTLVAVRTDPTRQVWVAFRNDAWARTADYVIFWQNVFDWLAEVGQGWSSQDVEWLGPEWRLTNPPAGVAAGGLWPGIYERRDATSGGVMWRAVNAPAVHIPPVASGDWRGQLKRLSPGQTSGAPVARWFLLVAVGALALAAATWPRAKKPAHTRETPRGLAK